MNATLSLILDVVILGLLVYWCVMGCRRGLVLSLCSLLAVVVALAGGWYLSNHTYEPLADRLEPLLVQAVGERADAALPEQTAPAQEDSGQNSAGVSGPLAIFSQNLQSQIQNFKEATVAQLAADMAQFIAKSILFLVGFLAVLLIWNILFHALHLVTRLPGLHFLNKFLGGVFGLIKGVLLLLVARWLLCDLLGWIPSEVAEGSRMLSLLASLSLSGMIGG